MRLCSRASIFWVSAVVGGGVLGGPVSAALAATDPTASPPAASQGIAQAKAAGVQIDPAAIPIMESAPLNSCLNNPIQTQCGTPPAAIVAGGGPSTSDPRFNLPGFTMTGYGPSSSSGSAGAAPNASYPHCSIGAKINILNNGTRMHGEAPGGVRSSCLDPVCVCHSRVVLDLHQQLAYREYNPGRTLGAGWAFLREHLLELQYLRIAEMEDRRAGLRGGRHDVVCRPIRAGRNFQLRGMTPGGA
jgi:hypothetical protein